MTAVQPTAAAAVAVLLARPLIPQELQALEPLGRAVSNRGSAAWLRLAERTVNVPIGSLLGKLGVTSRPEAALLAGAYLP